MSGYDVLKSGTANGHRFEVRQMDWGHFCGYVRVNFGPQWSYDELRGYMGGLIDVHGGLTYGVDDDGWIGFDCAHAGDVCKIDGEIQTDYEMSTVQEWSVDDVAAECQKLCRQVDTLETFAENFEKRGWGHNDE